MASKTVTEKGLENYETTNGFQISFQSYGVKIGVRADSLEFLSKVKNELDRISPNDFEYIEDSEADRLYEIKLRGNENFELIRDGARTPWSGETDFLLYLQSQIRLTIAEYAESRVFLHAGVVGWKGKAIIFPGRSFSGKTSLVTELVKKGALYYSDDFAVLDQDGLVHPFHRELSLRGIIDHLRQVDFPVEALGGEAGSEPLPVGIVLITDYREGRKNPKKWTPKILSGGQGVMEIISHTIPIRYNPEFALKVLNKVARRAIICKSQRGEAAEFADLLLDFFETKVIK